MSGAGSPGRRRQTIREIVAERPIASQAELVRALARRGFRVTQATLSRDLKALRIARVPTADGYRYGTGGAEAGDAAPGSLAAAEVISVESNEIAVVLKTLAGRAQGVGVFLDGLKHPDVLGTLAGDDTVVVLPRSVRRTARLRTVLRKMFRIEAAGAARRR